MFDAILCGKFLFTSRKFHWMFNHMAWGGSQCRLYRTRAELFIQNCRRSFTFTASSWNWLWLDRITFRLINGELLSCSSISLKWWTLIASKNRFIACLWQWEKIVSWKTRLSIKPQIILGKLFKIYFFLIFISPFHRYRNHLTFVVVAQCIVSITFSLGTIAAANGLHTILLAAVLRLPMTFFDVTPLGRILNRFAKDVDVCDNVLPHVLRMFIAMTFSVSCATWSSSNWNHGDIVMDFERKHSLKFMKFIQNSSHSFIS